MKRSTWLARLTRLDLRWLAAPLLLASALGASAAEPASGEAASPGWILGKLAQPAPMATPFVEVRESRMLKNALRLSGEYRRPQDGVLVRAVRDPYVETTTIHAGQATIERAGRAPRTFSLARAPELAGLQDSFGALLSGDRAALEALYRLRSEGTPQQWSLELTPTAAELARRLQTITLYGQDAELRCIETRMVDEPKPQRTLLASAAEAAPAVVDADGLARLCHQGVASR
ncbi:LolA-related protein [Lysobacter sp. H21R4]|uniref:LolA-related protein n=1 Tax=Lysobacter sp. H21R4 TaxID=2781021 RepID=UPI001E2C9A74|nr:LolA-related protein [Lysobacter sp. H21R4]